MKQLVAVPTRVTLNTSSLLDIISSTDHESHSITGVYHTSLRDHYMIYTVYDRMRTTHDSNNNVLKFRNYKKFSIERFINDILACDYMIQVGILVYSKPNGMSFEKFLRRSVIFMLHFTVVN